MPTWIVLFTKPHKESMVASLLEADGLETYLPTVRPVRLRRDRRPEIPLFPRYLFARVEREHVPRSQLQWTAGVVSVVNFDGQIAFVAQEVIDWLRRRVLSLSENGYGAFKSGQRVRITEGPLKDLEGVFEKPMSAGGRVRIFVNVLGRLTAAEIDYSALEPARAGS